MMKKHFHAVLISLLWSAVPAVQAQAKPRPVILVEAVYPGAGAQVVAEAVAAPIEQHVKGLAKVVHMISRCGNDGSYALTITLEHGADLDASRKDVQQRLSLAEPVLPEEVKRLGIKITKWSGQVPLFVALRAPGGKFDRVYLTNYARTNFEDEPKRIPGVGAVSILGGTEQSVRVTLDANKLAANGLTALDVAKVLLDKGKVPAGQIGQPPAAPGAMQFQINLGPMASLKDFEDIVVKTTDKGTKIRLKDIGKVAVETRAMSGEVRHQGQPIVVLSVTPAHQVKPAAMAAAVRGKLKQFAAKLPKGIALDMVFDPADGAEYLLLDVTLAAGSSAERSVTVCDEVATLLAKAAGAKDLLAVTDPGISNRACVLVRLGAAAQKPAGREKAKKAIRALLAKNLPDALVQLRDFAPSTRFPWADHYPVAIGIRGPDAKVALAAAESLAQRLTKSGKVTDVGVNPDSVRVPKLYLEIDRKALAKNGVTVGDLFDALKVWAGDFHLNDVNIFGKNWSIVLRVVAETGPKPEALAKLNVRNAQGQMVPLSKLVTIRETQPPAAIVLWNGQPVVTISANPLPGTPAAAIRKLCEALAKEELPKGYHLAWLAD
jgi:multidrug efflux pump subunit AcrB